MFPSQAEVDRYWDRWQRVVAAEPVLLGRHPQRYRGTTPFLYLVTANEAIESAWRERTLVTGVPAFDELISELEGSEIDATMVDIGDGSVGFGVRIGKWPFNEEFLHNRLVPTMSRLEPVFIRSQDDGTWTWQGRPTRDTGSDEDTAQIDFTFGWFDCTAGCGYFHSLRAVVPTSGRALVCDLGGDPLDGWFELAPETTPCEQ